MDYKDKVKSAFKINIQSNFIVVKEYFITDYEIENLLYNSSDTCVGEENINNSIENFIKNKIRETEQELLNINKIFENTSPLIKFILSHEWFNLFIFKGEKSIKNIKKYIVKKRFLEKKNKKLHQLINSIEQATKKELIKNRDIHINEFNKKHLDLINNGYCYVVKIVNNDDSFRTFLNIKKQQIIPITIKTINDKNFYVFAVNENKGSEYTDLITIDSINNNGVALKTKKIIKKNPQELKDFLHQWKGKFDNDFEFMLKSIDYN